MKLADLLVGHLLTGCGKSTAKPTGTRNCARYASVSNTLRSKVKNCLLFHIHPGCPNSNVLQIRPRKSQRYKATPASRGFCYLIVAVALLQALRGVLGGVDLSLRGYLTRRCLCKLEGLGSPFSGTVKRGVLCGGRVCLFAGTPSPGIQSLVPRNGLYQTMSCFVVVKTRVFATGLWSAGEGSPTVSASPDCFSTPPAKRQIVESPALKEPPASTTADRNKVARAQSSN